MFVKISKQHIEIALKITFTPLMENIYLIKYLKSTKPLSVL